MNCGIENGVTTKVEENHGELLQNIAVTSKNSENYAVVGWKHGVKEP